MTKENHFIPLLKKGIQRIQEPVSRLVPPEAFGPELDRFRSSKHTLFAWKNKQFQNWNFWGQLTTKTGRPVDFGLQFFERRNERDRIGLLPLYFIKERFFGAQFTLIDPLNADTKKGFQFWTKGIGRNRHQGFASEEGFHLHLGSWNVFEKNPGSYILSADSSENSLYLELEDPYQKLTFFGQSGYLDLGSESGQSYFKAAIPFLKAKGKLVLGQRSEDVQGDVWLGHQKTSLAFGYDQNRSKRFDECMIRLPDGKSLLLCLSDYNKCLTLVNPDGQLRYFVSSEFKIEDSEFWTNPKTKNRYPVKRVLTVDSLNLQVTIKAVFPHQEIVSLTNGLLTGQTAFWFGSILAEGKVSEKEFKSRGFMRLEGMDQGILSKIHERLISIK